jgi:membrane-associated phospholipid phosphatase
MTTAPRTGRPAVLVNNRRGLLVGSALLVGAVVVGVLVVAPATHPAVQAVDDAVWRFAGAVRNRPSTAVSVGLSWLGSAWVNWPLRGAALLLLAWRRHWLRLAALALAIASSEVLIGVVKAAVDRPRPPGSLIDTSAAAFPSGHAIASAVTAVGLVLALVPAGRARWRWEVRAVVFTTVMALSRVYLRAHWLSDTVAGGLLGAGLALAWPALLVALVALWRQPRSGERRPLRTADGGGWSNPATPGGRTGGRPPAP